jgi:hypothetical protein
MKNISLLTLAFLFTDTSFGKVQIGRDFIGEKAYYKYGKPFYTVIRNGKTYTQEDFRAQ